MRGQGWITMGLLAGLACGLSACGTPSRIAPSHGATALHAQDESALKTAFVSPEAFPADLLPQVLMRAQNAADHYHTILHGELHQVAPNPFGLAVSHGEDQGFISFGLAPCVTRPDLQLEWRAYTGANTHIVATNPSGAGYVRPAIGDRKLPALEKSGHRGDGLEFGLPTTLPDAVNAAYDAYLAPLSTRLVARYGARSMSFDYPTQIFTIESGDETLGFVYSALRSRLMLSESSFANVQSVVVLAADGQLAGDVTIVDFNPRSYSPDTPPVYRFTRAGAQGILVEIEHP